MRLIIVILALGALCVAGPAVTAEPFGLSVALQAQVESPTVAPTETNPAAWATLIWIAVGLVFLILLVGATLLGVRSTGNRPPGSWRRRTRE